jgi:hypothetical protein
LELLLSAPIHVVRAGTDRDRSNKDYDYKATHDFLRRFGNRPTDHSGIVLVDKNGRRWRTSEHVARRHLRRCRLDHGRKGRPDRLMLCEIDRPWTADLTGAMSGQH